MSALYRSVLLLLLFFSFTHSYGQYKLYESTFNGGVVTGGYSNGATVPSGSGTFNVTIPPGSSIRRAYLIAGRCGAAPNVTVTLNGTSYTFTNANAITNGFNTIYGGSSGVHAIDITAGISAATATYTIAVPVQNTVSDKYPEFYLYIAFDNPGMPAVNSAIYLNTATLSVSSIPWTLTTTATVNNGSPVGLAIMGGYATTGTDCETVIVNGTNVGSYGGQDFNASSQWGCMAGFQYYNNTLTGYNDDNANQAIANTDALSNIQLVIPGSTNSIPVTFNHCGGGGDNHIWAVFLTWAGVILDGESLNFEAHPETDHVATHWQVNDESALAKYVVERSLNGQDFEAMAELTIENPGQSVPRAWKDLTPAFGSNWYRLKAITRDGLADFSAAQLVEWTGTRLAAQLSPNPVAAGTPLLLSGLPTGATQWVIYSLADGRAMRNGTLDAAAASVPTQDLAPGAYGIRLLQGNAAQSLRFVIQ